MGIPPSFYTACYRDRSITPSIELTSHPANLRLDVQHLWGGMLASDVAGNAGSERGPRRVFFIPIDNQAVRKNRRKVFDFFANRSYLGGNVGPF